MKQKEPIKLKLILIGGPGTGKTQLLNQFVNNQYHENYQKTIGIDFFNKTNTISNLSNTEDVEVRAQIWDTGGEERFRSFMPDYLKDSKTVGIVVTPDDLETLPFYNTLAKTHTETAPIYVIINKIDLYNKEKVKSAIDTIKKNMPDAHILLTSAKTKEGVNKVFQTMERGAYAYSQGVRLIPKGKVIEQPPRSSPTVIERIEMFVSAHKLWMRGNAALIVGIVVALAVVAAVPGLNVIVAGGLTALALAGIVAAATLLLWNAVCAFGNWLNNRMSKEIYSDSGINEDLPELPKKNFIPSQTPTNTNINQPTVHLSPLPGDIPAPDQPTPLNNDPNQKPEGPG